LNTFDLNPSNILTNAALEKEVVEMATEKVLSMNVDNKDTTKSYVLMLIDRILIFQTDKA